MLPQVKPPPKAVKTTVSPEAWITGFLPIFHTAEEGLHGSIKALEGSLARGEISPGKVGICLPVLGELCRLLFVSNRTLFALVKVLSLGESVVVQVPMRVEERKQRFLLLLAWIGSVLKRLLHRALIGTPPVSLNPEIYDS